MSYEVEGQTAVLITGQLRNFEAFLENFDLSNYDVFVACSAECRKRHSEKFLDNWIIVTDECNDLHKFIDGWASLHIPMLRQWLKLSAGANIIFDYYAERNRIPTSIVKIRTDTHLTMDQLDQIASEKSKKNHIMVNSDLIFSCHIDDLAVVASFSYNFLKYYGVDLTLTREQYHGVSKSLSFYAKLDWISRPIDLFYESFLLTFLCRVINSLGYELVSNIKPFKNKLSSEAAFLKHLIDQNLRPVPFKISPVSLKTPKIASNRGAVYKKLSRYKWLFLNLRLKAL